MGMWERMMARFGYVPTGAKAAKKEPASRAAQTRVITWGQPVSPVEVDTELSLNFSWRHPYFFSCVNHIASAAMGVPLRVLRMVPDPETAKSGNWVTKATAQHCQKQHAQFETVEDRQAWLLTKGLVEEEVPLDHALVVLLDQVSPVSTWGRMIYQTLFDLESAGNAYWELVGGADGAEPTQLWRMRPEQVKVVPDEKTVVGGYVLNANGQEIKFDVAEVLHFSYPHPLDDYYGLSRAATLDLVLRTDWNRIKYANRFFETGAQLSGVLVLDDDVQMPPEEYKRMQEEFEKYLRKIGLLF